MGFFRGTAGSHFAALRNAIRFHAAGVRSRSADECDHRHNQRQSMQTSAPPITIEGNRVSAHPCRLVRGQSPQPCLTKPISKLSDRNTFCQKSRIQISRAVARTQRPCSPSRPSLFLMFFGLQYFKPKKAPEAPQQQRLSATERRLRSSRTPHLNHPPRRPPLAPKSGRHCRRAPRQAESTTIVENELYRIQFTNRGAQVTSWILKKYKDSRRQAA